MFRDLEGTSQRTGEFWTVESEAGTSLHPSRDAAAYAMHGLLLMRVSGWATVHHFVDGVEVHP